MRKRPICILAVLALLLCGCSGVFGQPRQYSVTYLNLFDTVTTIVGYADSEKEFQTAAKAVYDALEEYHRLFDIYNTYEGVANLKTVNDMAGIAPVTVDTRIIQLLRDCKAFYEATGGKVNVAMGSVLALWHEARSQGLSDPEKARLPEQGVLEEAARHTDLDAVILDETASTVYIFDPKVRLDVGAIAKGWAVQQVAETAAPGLLISVGGNVCVTGPKDEAGNAWVVGVQHPDGRDRYLDTISITGGSVVTSGDYQRSYMVDGKSYHHIIDPDTLYPSQYWRSVTVVCPDSGTADALSTALFLLPLAEGHALLEKFDAKAMWMDGEGELYYSAGFLKRDGKEP